MTNEFAVIGHHRDDSESLLLLGADGHHYRYDLTDNQMVSVDLGDEWVLEPTSQPGTPASGPSSPLEAGP